MNLTYGICDQGTAQWLRRIETSRAGSIGASIIALGGLRACRGWHCAVRIES